MIRVEGLTKVFRRPRTFSGPFGALRTLVTRQYEEKTAVDDVSFDIGEGEVIGYLGPNGAGKSTTIKILTGILTPTAGTVRVNGLVPWRDRSANARRVGVVFGQRSQLWWDLPLIESLRLVGSLYDLPAARFETSLKKLRDLLGLDEFLDTPVRQLSLGQRMRGDLAAAVLYEPPLLYLDEPTVGLDVLAKEAVREFIVETNRTGRTTVILTTHDLADVEALCKRIILIDHGKVLFDGPIDALVDQPRRLVVLLESAPEEVRGVSRDDQGRHVFDIHGDLPAMIASISAEHTIRDLSIEEPDLESVIKGIYAR
ncbi:ABC transporter ATP-binding protein [Nonomuraea ferruginea]|uniref:ATP-binding cassette domain-containing protein n=1 Tax=Nonomuraea ferruginea TaxID=46174 RepID=A0ABT4SPV5_9ACTN|nr:ATP-binding cassette domain-containing protein [Nonomuraea ferruginea]MDA0639276.1 ATP-binding cassette domain-containing protein [Nonomuraea ferruginea]